MCPCAAGASFTHAVMDDGSLRRARGHRSRRRLAAPPRAARLAGVPHRGHNRETCLCEMRRPAQFLRTFQLSDGGSHAGRSPEAHASVLSRAIRETSRSATWRTCSTQNHEREQERCGQTADEHPHVSRIALATGRQVEVHAVPDATAAATRTSHRSSPINVRCALCNTYGSGSGRARPSPRR